MQTISFVTAADGARSTTRTRRCTSMRPRSSATTSRRVRDLEAGDRRHRRPRRARPALRLLLRPGHVVRQATAHGQDARASGATRSSAAARAASRSSTSTTRPTSRCAAMDRGAPGIYNIMRRHDPLPRASGCPVAAQAARRQAAAQGCRRGSAPPRRGHRSSTTARRCAARRTRRCSRPSASRHARGEPACLRRSRAKVSRCGSPPCLHSPPSARWPARPSRTRSARSSSQRARARSARDAGRSAQAAAAAPGSEIGRYLKQSINVRDRAAQARGDPAAEGQALDGTSAVRTARDAMNVLIDRQPGASTAARNPERELAKVQSQIDRLVARQSRLWRRWARLVAPDPRG